MSSTPKHAIDRVLLIPGLIEPRIAFLPMKSHLATSFRQVDIWRDRYIFRNVEASVSRLAELISGETDGISLANDGAPLAIVTHSFGDWVARQAIARCSRHRVAALVSIAPVMRGGVVPRLIHFLGGDLIPEIAIIADAGRASASLDCDAAMRRLIVWAAMDVGVRRVDLSGMPNVLEKCVVATHLSVVMQPNVLKLVHRFLKPEDVAKDGSVLHQHPVNENTFPRRR